MKKRSIKRILPAVVAVLALSIALGYFVIASSSQPTVMYDGYEKDIFFENVNPFADNTEPDLFTDLKDLMPGDSASQKIRIGAKNLGFDGVRIHLRAENPNDDYKKLVEDYGEWVGFTVKNGNKEITGNLKQGVTLGTFFKGDTAEVDVTLDIDIDAGNELQSLIAEVDWVFTAEFLPGYIIVPGGGYNPGVSPEPAPDTGETGDGDQDDDGEDGEDGIAYLPDLVTSDHINYIIGYEDGTVRPQASITRAEVATIFYRLLKDETREKIFCTESVFPDVCEDDWFFVAVCTLTNGGFLEGYPDGTFRPNDYITRAELATIISRFDSRFGSIEPDSSFPDTEKHWSQEYVEFSAECGYVLGYPNGTFMPDKDITRAETVAMVNRLLMRAVDDKGVTEEYITWDDNLRGTWYYYDVIEAANSHDYTRSERSAELYSFCYEDWICLEEPIDWKKVEAEWILIYTDEE